MNLRSIIGVLALSLVVTACSQAEAEPDTRACLECENAWAQQEYVDSFGRGDQAQNVSSIASSSSSSSFDMDQFIRRLREFQDTEDAPIAAGVSSSGFVSSSSLSGLGKQPLPDSSPLQEPQTIGSAKTRDDVLRLRAQTTQETLASIPARCGQHERSFLAFAEGSLDCGTTGFAATGLIDGNCPISACILRYGTGEPSFAGSLP